MANLLTQRRDPMIGQGSERECERLALLSALAFASVLPHPSSSPSSSSSRKLRNLLIPVGARTSFASMAGRDCNSCWMRAAGDLSLCPVIIPQYSSVQNRHAPGSMPRPVGALMLWTLMTGRATEWQTAIGRTISNLKNAIFASDSDMEEEGGAMVEKNWLVKLGLVVPSDDQDCSFSNSANPTSLYAYDPLRAHNFAAIIPGNSAAEMVVTNGIFNFLNIYNTLLVARLVLTWFPNPPQIIANPLSTVCDPYLNLFRGIIPPLGGSLDLSPILAFLTLNIFTSTAAALPAEMPRDGEDGTTLKKQGNAKRTWRQNQQLKKGQAITRSDSGAGTADGQLS